MMLDLAAGGCPTDAGPYRTDARPSSMGNVLLILDHILLMPDLEASHVMICLWWILRDHIPDEELIRYSP